MLQENVGMDGQRKSVKHSAEKRLKMTQKQPLACSMRPLCVLYGCSMISHPVRHLELSIYKGTKKVRETLDMVSG